MWFCWTGLTLLVSNLLLANTGEDEQMDEGAIYERALSEIKSLLEIIVDSKSHWIVVSNELGLGLVPPYPLGRFYRDVLGSVNQKVAVVADEVFFLAAGIAIPIHQYRE